MKKDYNFEIITDSSSDLTEQMQKDTNVGVVPLSVTIDGKTYRDYPDERDISRKDFYNLIRNKKLGVTSAPNILEFKNCFKKVLSEGKDLLYIGFSSALSSTFSNAKVAADELKNVYPENKILLCDSLCASLGQGALVYYACKKKDLGFSLDEVYTFVENTKLKICHFFTVENLKYLQRGGRVPKIVSIAGNVLNIKPIMYVDNRGRLIKLYSIRGRNNSIEELALKVKSKSEYFENTDIFSAHGDCLDDALMLKKIISKLIKPKNFYINTVGPVIGSHSGPGTLAVFCVGNDRKTL